MSIVTGHEATRPAASAPEPIRMRGLTIRCRVSGAQSGGAVSVLEQLAEPGAGSPPHRCLDDQKVITVLDGTFVVRCGDETATLRDGESVVVPPGTVHNFVNAGTAPGRVLVTLTPGGHEEFLRALAAMGGPANADPVELAALCAQHGVRLGAS